MYHRTFNCILSYRLPFVKNILTTIFMQDYSTTLRFCTSSDPQRDIWSCYRRKIHAITLLQNQILYWCLLSLVLLPYEFTLLQNRPTTVDFLTRVLLPYEFTLLQNLKRGLKLLPVHVSQDIQLHLIISPPFCQKYIDYHIYASLFNYPAILHLFSPSKRHLKLLPAQNARNYTTPKLVLIYFNKCFLFYYPMNLHYSKTDYDCYISKLGFCYLMNLHYSKTSKEDIWSCYQCMYHKAFQLHFIISPTFC